MAINVNPGTPLRHVSTFTSSGTWTAPQGTTLAFVSVQGAAGGGGGGGNRSRYGPDSSGGAGGNGMNAAGWVQVNPGAAHVITIGANGTAGITQVGGTSGGNTSFDGAIFSLGGAGGGAGGYNGAGGAGSAGSSVIQTALTLQSPSASTLARVLNSTTTNSGGVTGGPGGGQNASGNNPSGTPSIHIYI
jgi:hypothetical protein